MVTKKFLLLLLGFGLLATSCKKNHFKKYEVEGHFYYNENREPMKNVPLVLIISDGGCEFGCNTYDEIAEATTDENGYFKFKYSQDNRDGTLQIAYDDSKTQGQATGGTIATNLPKNEDIFMDFFVVAKAYYRLKFNVINNDIVGDTLFVSASGLESNEELKICLKDTNLIEEDRCTDTGFWTTKITSTSFFYPKSMKYNFDQDFSFSNPRKRIWWGVTRKQMLQIGGEPQLYRDHELSIKPTQYPDTTIVEIDIW